MRKIVAILLTLTMALSLAGCSGQPEQGAEQTEIPSASGSIPPSPEKPEPQASVEKLPEFEKTASIEETVLVDEGGVRIIATGLHYTDYSAQLDVTIENNTEKNLSFISSSLAYSCNSVNGVMVQDGYLSCDVAAGKKAVDSLSFRYDALQLYGIQEIADLEVGIYVNDEDYNSAYFEPRRVTTSAFEGYDYTIPRYRETISGGAAQNTFDYELLYFGTDPLYEREGLSLLSQTLIRDRDGKPILLAEVENRSEEMRAVSLGGVTVNGLVLKGGRWSSDLIAPGKTGVLDIDLHSVLDERFWEVYGLEEIGNVGFDLQQFTTDGRELTGREPVLIEMGEIPETDTVGQVVYDQNGVRLTAKTVLGPGEYDSYFDMLLLAENTGTDAVEVEIPYHELSVNGFMADYMGETWRLAPGGKAVMDIQLYEGDLKDIQVTKAEEITQVEFPLELRQGKTVLDTPTVSLDLTK